MKLNIESGMIRLWVVVVGLIFTVTAFISYSDVKKAAEIQNSSMQYAKIGTLLLPVDCSNIRGVEDVDWTRNLDDGHCWYELPKFRKLYPEYKDISDDRVRNRLYGRAGLRTPTGPILLSIERAGIAALLSAVLLLVGLAIRWVVRGFASQREA